MRIRERFVDAGELAVDTSDELGGIAVFFDFENIILGVKDGFKVSNVINTLNERGEVMIRRAYADWGRYRRHQRQFLEEGVAMAFLPSYGTHDKNRTDTAICVDAMETLFTRPHIDTFVIVSGDSDFAVLAQRMRDHAKRVVGISTKSAASNILVKVCHEFIFYETLEGQRVQGYSNEDGEKRLLRAIPITVEHHGAEMRASVLKDRMRKQDPTFSERNYGAPSFTKFLRNYGHLVKVLERGMIRVVGGTEFQTPTGGNVRSAGERPANDRPPADRAPAKPVKLLPEVEAEARDVLARAMAQASPDGDPVSMSRLKDCMEAVAPNFDESGLGFRTFTRFLKAFPDIIDVHRDRNRVQSAAPPADGQDDGDQTEQPEPTAVEDAPSASATDEAGAASTEDTGAPAERTTPQPLTRAERRRRRGRTRPTSPVAASPAAPSAPDAAPEQPAKPAAKKVAAAKAAPKKPAAKKKAPSKKKASTKKAASKKKASTKKASTKKAASKKTADAGDSDAPPKKTRTRRKRSTKKATAAAPAE